MTYRNLCTFSSKYISFSVARVSMCIYTMNLHILGYTYVYMCTIVHTNVCTCICACVPSKKTVCAL